MEQLIIFLMIFLGNVQEVMANFRDNHNKIVDLYRSGANCDLVVPLINKMKQDIILEGTGTDSWRQESLDNVVEYFQRCFPSTGTEVKSNEDSNLNKPSRGDETHHSTSSSPLSVPVISTTGAFSTAVPAYSFTHSPTLPATSSAATLLFRSSTLSVKTPAKTAPTVSNICGIKSNVIGWSVWNYMATITIASLLVIIVIGLWYIKKLILRMDQIKQMAHRRQKYAKKLRDEEDRVKLTIV